MAIGWDESSVKRDYHGRFSRFVSGNIPEPKYLPSQYVDDWALEVFAPESKPPEVSDAYASYKGSAYSSINKALRGQAQMSEEDQAKTDLLLETMNATPLPHDVWVTRAVSPDAFGDKAPDELVGSTFEDPAFMSTTLTEDLPPQFADGGYKNEYPVTLKLNVPEGTPAYSDPARDWLHEHELTLAPGRQFDVTGVKQVDDGRWEVFGEVRPEPQVDATIPEMDRNASQLKSLDEAVPEIQEILERGEYEYYGLRTLQGGEVPEVGETLPPSQVWEDEQPTGEMLDGTSATELDAYKTDASDIEKVISRHKKEGYFGDATVLIGGYQGSSGEDPYETIIRDAEVLGVWKSS